MSHKRVSDPKVPSGARVVVMAGGRGTRLRPYTTVLPKPLMPVGDRPILEHVLESLASAGFERVTVSVGHLAELIQAFFGTGERWGLKIDYAIEDRPLHTMGALRFIEDLGEDFLVMMGDVLTDLHLVDLWEDHCRSSALLTTAVSRRQVQTDFGVLEYDSADRRIRRFEEKPVLQYDVSMGIHMLSRECLDFIPRGEPFGFDRLVLALLAAKKTVRAFPHPGKWLDIGRHEDYEKANEENTQ
ncbi:NTP transferase domain-containing protein [Candidatus Sumerlaeota bacterium]|nr:NTP transferase domain-containing protein [Candidatus Sumerlaeota bacterium]